MTTQILMPMGGLGSRFSQQGYTTPKPLILVDGKAMFMRALDSFTQLGDDKTNLFVIRRDQIEAHAIDKQIQSILPGAKIAVLESDTRGAVETCLLAESLIDDTLPVIVADCDIFFQSKEYVTKILSGNYDGLLLTFESVDPRYSYAEIDGSGSVVRTAEKVVISNHAILGGYYFSSGKLFKSLAHEFVDNPLPENLKEYYVSHLFNLMIERGLRIGIATIDEKHIFGTPEELEAYNNGKS